VTRLAIVGLLLVVVLALTWAWRRRQRALQVEAGSTLVPPELLGPGDRTWLLFRTPMCATCGPAAARLRSLDPGAEVVVIDAPDRPELVERFGIASAPTVLLATADGRVSLRLAGPRAVSEHLDALVAQR
jgi:uncharacterized protein (DUF2236 family)